MWEESKRPSQCFSWCASLCLFICIDVFSGYDFFSSGFVLFQKLCHNMWRLIFQSQTCSTRLAVVPSSVTLNHPSCGSYTVQNLVAGLNGAWALLTVDFLHKKRACLVHFKALGAWLEKLICFLLTSSPSPSKTYSCMNKKFTRVLHFWNCLGYIVFFLLQEAASVSPVCSLCFICFFLSASLFLHSVGSINLCLKATCHILCWGQKSLFCRSSSAILVKRRNTLKDGRQRSKQKVNPS